MKTFRYCTPIGFFLISSTLTAVGQHQFSFSANLAPVFAHTRFRTDIPSTLTSPVTLADYAGVSNGLNYSIGLMGWYNFSPKWSASAGAWATHPAINKVTITYISSCKIW